MGARAKTLSEADGAEFLTVGQAAQLVQVSPSTVREWCRNGRLRSYGAGRLVRVKRADVLAALQPRAKDIDARTEAVLERMRR